MFNTLRYAKLLEEVGFSREQAETSIKILVDIMEDKLATKEDLKELATKHEFTEFKTVMKQDFTEFKADIHKDFTEFKSAIGLQIANLESRLTIRMGTMLAASIAVLTAIQKLA